MKKWQSVVTLCSVAIGCQHFGGPCYLHVQGEVEVARSFKTLVFYCITARRHNPEDLESSLPWKLHLTLQNCFKLWNLTPLLLC